MASSPVGSYPYLVSATGPKTPEVQASMPISMASGARRLPHSRTTIARGRPLVEAGLAIGVEVQGDKPRIVVNLPAAKAEGTSFGSELLRLADIIR